MGGELVRVCPSCGAHHPPDRLRCTCGGLLFGVDLVRLAPLVAREQVPEREAAPAQTLTPSSEKPSTVLCPHDDCGQANPAGSERCLYCNRVMQQAGESTPEPAPTLIQLPAALRPRYRVLQMFEARGAEADILLVQPLQPEIRAAARLVAKIYRQGILPSDEVQARIARVDVRHRVNILESGRSDGRAYEVMEFCSHGSLRECMRGQALPEVFIVDVIKELAPALQAVHDAALVHRDLKPENVLLRSAEPLDLVLTDFSTASVMDATQRFTGMARTLLYAPPEALSGVLDAKADYWALGMLLLEMATGSHPFAGLSEAVILHHLTTRTMDVSGVRNARLRRLLRGLLLRDPQRRWGGGEVGRWLAGDDTLQEAVEHGVEAGFVQSYAVLHERCTTPEQLAVAFARHWHAGVADLTNGELLRWFTEVQKDQNAVRLLLGLRYDSILTPDEQLLRFILHFAPGIPPLWQGRSIELGALLTLARQALRGDEAAAEWLWQLRQHRVLDIYAAAGNAKAAELAERWSASADDFEVAWTEGLALLQAKAEPARGPAEVVSYDDVVYGPGVAGPSRPSRSALQPMLLAAAYDPAWVEAMRGRLLNELVALSAQCPWVVELGNPQAMTSAQLLAYEALLPELRKRAQLQARRDAEQARLQLAVNAELSAALQLSLVQISGYARRLSFLSSSESELLFAPLDEYLTLMGRIRAHGATEESWLTLRRQALRTEPVVLRMRIVCERLRERRTANAGWPGEEMAVIFVLGVMLSAWWRGGLGLLLFLALVTAIIAWRYLPVLHMVQDIHRLGRTLASHRVSVIDAPSSVVHAGSG